MGAAIVRCGIATVRTRATTDSHDINQPMRLKVMGVT
jgi:hypothetical protein